MKHTKRELIKLAGFDPELFDEKVVEGVYEDITGCMSELSKLVSIKYGLVKLGMKISGIETYQHMNSGDPSWQYIEIREKSKVHITMSGCVGGENFFK